MKRKLTKRQKEIIEKAIKLLAEKGISNLTIKNLSQEVGVSEPALYRHFENKLDIMRTILEFFKAETEDLVKEIKESDKSPIEKLYDFYLTHLETLYNKPSYTVAIFSEELFQGQEGLSQLITEIIDSNKETVKGFIRDAIKEGSMRDDLPLEHLAMIIMATLRLTIKRWFFSKEDYNLVNKGKNIYKTLETILRKEE